MGRERAQTQQRKQGGKPQRERLHGKIMTPAFSILYERIQTTASLVHSGSGVPLQSSCWLTMDCKIHFVPMLLAAGFVLCTYSLAQSAQLTTNSSQTNAAVHQPKPSPNVPVAPTSPFSVLGQPAEPATIVLTPGELTIKANNSSLAEILNQIAKTGGMSVDGLQKAGYIDQRIFGTYGPGQPREVLSRLLDGCGFNVIMLGSTPVGTPKTLSLSSRAPGGPTNPPAQSAAVQDQNYRENYAPTPTAYPQPENGMPSSPMQNPRLRTPREVLQQLQQMRERQNQPN